MGTECRGESPLKTTKCRITLETHNCQAADRTTKSFYKSVALPTAQAQLDRAANDGATTCTIQFNQLGHFQSNRHPGTEFDEFAYKPADPYVRFLDLKQTRDRILHASAEKESIV